MGFRTNRPAAHVTAIFERKSKNLLDRPNINHRNVHVSHYTILAYFQRHYKVKGIQVFFLVSCLFSWTENGKWG